MMILVTGGSGSGKSAYAEQLITEYGDASRYYIATMMVWDDEGRKKVEKHRRMRAEKQFQTIECQRDLQNLDLKFREAETEKNKTREAETGVETPEWKNSRIQGKTKAAEVHTKKRAVLLECMSNLAANEFFSHVDETASISETAAQRKIKEATEIATDRPTEKTSARTAEKILSGVQNLEAQTDLLVIVTNDIFDDGIRYPEETRSYQQLLGDINYRLASMADKVVEVVYTIPVIHKETKEKNQ